MEFGHIFGLPGGGHFDNLESLVLSTRDTANEIKDKFISVFEIAPKLRKVTIDGLWASTFLPTLSLPWAQLTHIDMADTFQVFTQWRAFFRNCPSLVQCAFAIRVEEPIIEIEGEPMVQFDDLFDMKLTVDNHINPNSSWFPCMAFPALEKLELRNASITLPWIDVMQPILRFNSLHRLTLKWNSISVPNLLTLLRFCPFVKEFYLTFSVGSHPDRPQLWDALTWGLDNTDPSECVLPNLGVLARLVRMDSCCFI